MRFVSRACPVSQGGEDYTNVEKIVVPDQGLTLKEILERFTRGEALPVGKDAQYGDDTMDVDLEKIKHLDLVDRQEFYEKLDEVKQKWQRQEKAKEKTEAEKRKAEEKAAFDKKVRLAARKIAKGEKSA